MLQYFYFYFIYFEAALFEPLDGAKLLVEVLQIPEDAREAVLVQSELVHQGQPFPEPPGEHFVLGDGVHTGAKHHHRAIDKRNVEQHSACRRTEIFDGAKTEGSRATEIQYDSAVPAPRLLRAPTSSPLMVDAAPASSDHLSLLDPQTHVVAVRRGVVGLLEVGGFLAFHLDRSILGSGRPIMLDPL